ncbi:proteasome subunit beta type-4-like [Scaptodrosophila lebanonensis]|uniref:Proteasome subunit beta n=1 Tax=Drosophila lebanonensis TaxID=7225 RepID=A0A6J2TYC9_DROLE|nr:proteasome subunit beta type-4-like [Scaptodrosophila lebanonensis]
MLNGGFGNLLGRKGTWASPSNNNSEYPNNTGFKSGELQSAENGAMVTTCSSVVGIKFDRGVMIAADTLVSYGNLSRFQNIDRVFKINHNILLGGSGDFPDVQCIHRTIEQKMLEDQFYEKNIDMRPQALSTWLTRITYTRNLWMKPLFVDLVVGGIDAGGKPYLANVNFRGRAFTDYVVTAGFARGMVVPLVRQSKPQRREFTAQEASNLISKCMEVLYYRNVRSISQYTVGICTENCCDVEGPFKVDEKWDVADMIRGY